MSTLCFRVPKHDDKPASLAEAVDAVRSGSQSENLYEVTPESFRLVPGSPFVHWASDRLRKRFAYRDTLEEPPLNRAIPI